MTNLARLRNLTLQLDLFDMRHKPTRIGLIACSKRKLSHRAPARQLYTGPTFGLARAWMESRAESLEGWAILSAKHGVVMPDDELEPYELHLDSLTQHERDAWARRTRAQIVERWGTSREFLVLASGHYPIPLTGYYPGAPTFERVTDVVGSWERWRRDEGLRPHGCTIGVLRKYLTKNCNPGAGCR